MILAEILLDQELLLTLRRGVLGLQLLRQRVRFVGPKFLLVGFRSQILIALATERDSR